MDSDRAVPTSGALVLLAILAGLFLTRDPLQRLRPEKPDPIPYSPRGDETFDVRLWQDPFGPVVTADLADSSRVRSRLNPPPGSTMVLAVMTRGGSYAEDKELRVRSRYAAVKALDAAGYSASDSEKLGILQCRLTCPFEWYTSGVAGKTDYDQVLLLWVSDQQTRRVLRELAFLYSNALEGGSPAPERLDFTFLGPTDSGRLAELVAERETLTDEEAGFWKSDGVAIHSSWATAPVDYIVPGADRDRDSVRSLLSGIRFESFVATDDRVIESLVGELERRKGGTLDGRIAILTEFDTLYGQALASAFGSTASGAKVDTLTYLRGIDGIRSPESDSEDSDGSSAEALVLDANVEIAQGEAQLDYLGRLARDLKKLDGQSDDEIVAIGVLGTDVYDKLLVLKALRPRFRKALFFTTDLDARFLESRHYPYTRNLIVAGSHGLHPPGRKTRELMFRDGYQTALYLATRRAVGRAHHGELPTKLFEIGRTRPVGLTGSGDRDSADAGCPVLSSLRAKETGSILLLVVLGGFLVGFLSREFRFLVPWPRNWDLWDVQKSAIYYASLAGVVGVYLLGRVDPEEPFAFLEGVSVWPTQMVRIALLGLTVFLFLKARRDLRLNADDLERDFLLGDSRCPGPTTAEDAKKEQPIKLWRKYRERGRSWTVPLAVTGFAALLGFVILERFGYPFVPVRGPLARTVDLVLGISSSLGLLFLTMYVAYRTQAASRFFSKLGKRRSYWCQAAIRDRLRGQGHFSGVEEWMDTRLIARRTECLDRLILYPFFVFTLMILAHNHWFDDWRMTTSVFLIFGPIGALALASVVVLRRTAHRARARSLHRVKRLALRAAASEVHSSDQSKAVMQAIEEEDAGAFTPLSKHPVIGAFLLPFSGVGALALVEILVRG